MFATDHWFWQIIYKIGTFFCFYIINSRILIFFFSSNYGIDVTQPCHLSALVRETSSTQMDVGQHDRAASAASHGPPS